MLTHLIFSYWVSGFFCLLLKNIVLFSSRQLITLSVSLNVNCCFKALSGKVWSTLHIDEQLALILSHGSYGVLLNSTPACWNSISLQLCETLETIPLTCFSSFFWPIFVVFYPFFLVEFSRKIQQDLTSIYRAFFSRAPFSLKLCPEMFRHAIIFTKIWSLFWNSARLLLGIFLLALCSRCSSSHRAWKLMGSSCLV